MTWLYLLHSTRPIRIKSGIGTKLRRRVQDVAKSTPGRQGVLFAVPLLFGARRVEQYLHKTYQRHHAPVRLGSGRTEYFRPGFWVLECVGIMALVFVGQWGTVLAGVVCLCEKYLI